MAVKKKVKAVTIEKACFGAGCFWGVQSFFDAIAGVTKTEVGYAGGNEALYPRPDYKQVCTDMTGHAEVVYVEYDSSLVKYDKLLDVFWENHDPTTPNRQGPDYGSQYRSVIFYYNNEQKKLAEKSLLQREKKIKKKIVTQIVAASNFHLAEEYHQKYLEKRGEASCHI